MTQNEKNLLLKDLCARLPYGVKFVIDNDQNNVRTLNGIREDIPYEDWQMCAFARGISAIPIEDIKPYLFPLSSMTDEQKEELNNIFDLDVEIAITHIKNGIPNLFTGLNRLNWFIKNHFDIYGLIPMGLATDATDKNIY